MLRYIIIILFNLLRKFLGINLFSTINISLGSKVKLSKCHFIGKFKIFSNSTLKSSTFFNTIDINENSFITDSKLDGTIKTGNKLNILKAKLFGNIKISSNVNIKNSTITGEVEIANNTSIKNSQIQGNIVLSTNTNIDGAQINGIFKLGEYSKLIGGGLFLHGDIDVGRFSSINGPNFDIYAQINKVIIGNFCSIARHVSIQEYNHNFNKVSSYFINQNVLNNSFKEDINSKGNIIIENDVWVGTHSVILSGSHISTGVIVAANSVVSGYIPPYAVVGGSPAKIIKFRFSQIIIDNLLMSKWWEWDKEMIIKNKQLFINDCDITISEKLKNAN